MYPDSSAEGALEFGVECPESEAALSLRVLTGIRDVTGGRRPELGDVTPSLCEELWSMSLFVLRCSFLSVVGT